MTSQLPAKPSALIRLALRDLELCEKDERYRIDMDIWHSPEGGKCEVCLAGAVLAKTLGVCPDQNAIPSDDDSQSRKLRALDNFRTGNVELGLLIWGFRPEDGFGLHFNVMGYHENPVQFKADMNRIASFLEKHRW